MEEGGEEIRLLASSNHTLNNQNSTTPTTTTSLTTTIYPKHHLKHSKFNLLNRLNRSNDYFLSSNAFFNFILNRKVLEKGEYQKLGDNKNNFINSVKKEVGTIKQASTKSKEVDEVEEPLADSISLTEKIPTTLIDKKCEPDKNQFVLQNKPPIWNETNQVYQLDFGGRVTQESAKNFQIEFGGKQVMQFGRIDPNGYTLDFEWPFTAVQAFCIALANITQRFK